MREWEYYFIFLGIALAALSLIFIFVHSGNSAYAHSQFEAASPNRLVFYNVETRTFAFKSGDDMIPIDF